MFKKYNKKSIAELRQVTQEEISRGHIFMQINKISISSEDIKKGSPKQGDMVARNIENNQDQWLVSKEYFEKNFELIEETNIESETKLEYDIQNKNLNAPRLTPSHIDSVIKDIKYYIVQDTTTTICSLILENGFVVNGESAAASKENFDEEIGRKIAYENARNKIWQLEGYILKQKLYEGQKNNGKSI